MPATSEGSRHATVTCQSPVYRLQNKTGMRRYHRAWAESAPSCAVQRLQNVAMRSCVYDELQWNFRGCIMVELLASWRGRSLILACGKHIGRCRWSAGFLRDLPRPFISVLLYTNLASPSSALETSILRAAKSLRSLIPEIIIRSYLTPDVFELATICAKLCLLLLLSPFLFRLLSLAKSPLTRPLSQLVQRRLNEPHSSRKGSEDQCYRHFTLEPPNFLQDGTSKDVWKISRHRDGKRSRKVSTCKVWPTLLKIFRNDTEYAEGATVHAAETYLRRSCCELSWGGGGSISVGRPSWITAFALPPNNAKYDEAPAIWELCSTQSCYLQHTSPHSFPTPSVLLKKRESMAEREFIRASHPGLVASRSDFAAPGPAAGQRLDNRRLCR
ncbi:hypothetical protein PR048_003453 [Dryococelus australis]|uniref:Uncharacterized protein n=1 Tax=Dryococelus australis TaxID=614101 RepID=A0ABQ9IN44_9NEOP|nr:hypothetical protein PR048_003453 [Dryococelus australis]